MSQVDGYSAKLDPADVRDVRLLLRGLQDEAPKILSRALNKTVTKARTESSKAIRGDVRLKAAYVRQRLSVRKANPRNLSAKIMTPSRGLLLSRFSTNSQIASPNISWIKAPDEPPRGIRVKVKPSGGTQTISGDSETKGKPFYLALKNGRLAIAARRKTVGPRGGKIKVFYGPSLSQVFKTLLPDLQEPLAEYQEEQVSKQIDAVLRGY